MDSTNKIDLLINDYNYAISTNENAAVFKEMFIRMFYMYNKVSEFEKIKDIYKALFMNDTGNTELLERYNQLNIVENIKEKYDLVIQILKAKERYSKDELEHAKVTATKQKLLSDKAPYDEAPSAVAPYDEAPSAVALSNKAPSDEAPRNWWDKALSFVALPDKNRVGGTKKSRRRKSRRRKSMKEGKNTKNIVCK
jgi:hypothetical protein